MCIYGAPLIWCLEIGERNMNPSCTSIFRLFSYFNGLNCARARSRSLTHTHTSLHEWACWLWWSDKIEELPLNARANATTMTFMMIANAMCGCARPWYCHYINLQWYCSTANRYEKKSNLTDWLNATFETTNFTHLTWVYRAKAYEPGVQVYHWSLVFNLHHRRHHHYFSLSRRNFRFSLLHSCYCESAMMRA